MAGHGAPESFLEAPLFIEAIEKRQGYKIEFLEESALRYAWVDHALAKHFAK